MATPNHSTPNPSSLPTLLDILVGDAAGERDRWFRMIAASLDPTTLFRLEAQAMRQIAARYPDDPGSLFNWRYRQGQWLKNRLQEQFDRTHQRLIEQQIAQMEAIRALFLAHAQATISHLLYQERRAAEQQRRRDHLEDVITTGLAHDHEYQRTEATADGALRRDLDLRQATAALE